MFSLILLASVSLSNAQDVKRSVGFGLQTAFPSFGLSAKYAINDASMVQAIIAPFGTGTWNTNYFAGRYLHRFLDAADLGSGVSLDPYVYGSLGVVTYNWKYAGYKYKDSFFSFGVGGGAEVVLGEKFGVSAEIGLGQFGISNYSSSFGLMSGIGLHYYIR